jgi:hypothetical protein
MDRKCLIITGTAICVVIFIILVVVLSIELQPVHLATGQECELSDLTNQMTLHEVYFSLGYQLDIYLSDNTKFGFITSTINYNPAKNTYQMKATNYSNVAQITVTQNIFSLTTNFEYTACTPLGLEPFPEYKVAETLTESLSNSLSGIYTSYTIYKNGAQIAVSNKLSLIDTDMQIVDNNSNVVATMTRNAFSSFLTDKWNIINNRPDIIDNWVVAFIPSLVTIKMREKQNNN